MKRKSKDRGWVEWRCYLREMRGIASEETAGPAHSWRAGHDLATEELSSAHQLLFYKYNQLLFDLSTSAAILYLSRNLSILQVIAPLLHSGTISAVLNSEVFVWIRKEKKEIGTNENLQASKTCAIRIDMTVKNMIYGTYNKSNVYIYSYDCIIIRGVTSSRPAGWRGG